MEANVKIIYLQFCTYGCVPLCRMYMGMQCACERIIGFRPGLELEAVVGAVTELYIEQCTLLATESSLQPPMAVCLNGTLSIQMTQKKNRNKPEDREQRVSG